MKIDPGDRPRVKVECLRLLATLRLNPARTRLISGFVDTYLRLNMQEEQVFQNEVGTLEESEQEDIMQIVTSWMEQGIAKGRTEGRTEEARSLILRQLIRRFGTFSVRMKTEVQSLNLQQLEALSEALLDFDQLSDLTDWLHSSR
jgi:Domain of unknown function (DUF4351)